MKTLARIVCENIKLFLRPLAAAARTDAGRAEFAADTGINLLGLQPEESTELLADFGNIFRSTETLLEGEQLSLSQLKDLLDLTTNLIPLFSSKLSVVSRAGMNPFADEDAFSRTVFNILLVRFIQRRYPYAFFFGRMIGVLSAVPNAGPYIRAYMFSPHTLVNFFKDPIRAVRDACISDLPLETLHDANIASQLLFPILGELIATVGGQYAFNLRAVYAGTEVESSYSDDENEMANGLLVLRIPTSSGATGLCVIIQLVPTQWGGPGISIVPMLSGPTIPLEDWSIDLDVAANAIALLGSGCSFQPLPESEARVLVATIRISKNVTESNAFVLGDSTSSRLEIGTFTITGSFDFDLDTPGLDDFGLEAEALNGKLVISPSDTDTFLKAVLPGDGLSFNFDFGVGWSRKRGLYFKGAGSLDAALPINVNLGDVLYIPTLYLALRADTQGIYLEASAAAFLWLGPFAATVDRVGMFASFDFKEDYDGNLGPLDLDLGFKPPTGIGLVIDAGSVTGGGFLALNYEKGEYTGAVGLDLNGLALGAIGILNARLENDPDAFSLLVLISSDIPAIQLGFGITLNGVGGLLGVHRSLNTEALQAGLKQGTLDSILFPEDVVENAGTIIRDLQAVCPPTPDRYVIGPMVRLAWGTDSMVTATLAVLLEFPEPFRLVLLGQLIAALPEPEHPIVLIQLDVLGVLDFDRKTAAIDATLRDSRILDFPLNGDFALRASWGTSPSFALAAGGFNPAAQVPSGFPKLNRLSLPLSNTADLKLRGETYVAITSNTAQFGAALDLQARYGELSCKGHLAFDTLFQFSPFQFGVDVSGSFAISVADLDLCSATLSLLLSGPNGWHAAGKVEFEVLGVESAISFDVRFGTPRAVDEPEPVEIVAMARAALLDVRNWQKLPPTEETLVTLHADAQSTSACHVHPLGGLAVKQNVIPLSIFQEIALDKYGSSTISGLKTARVSQVSLQGLTISLPDVSETPRVESLSSPFAAAQFFEMSDAEKLSSPSFEDFEAGFSFVVTNTTLGCENGETPDIVVAQTYETVVIDKRTHGLKRGTITGAAYQPLASRVRRLAKAGASGRAARLRTGRKRFGAQPMGIRLGSTLWGVANRITGEPLELGESSTLSGGLSYRQANQVMQGWYAENGQRGTLEVMPLHEMAEAA